MKTIVMLGVGSTYLTRGIVESLIAKGDEWDVRLVDIDPKCLKIATPLSKRLVETCDAPVTISGSLGRLRGCSTLSSRRTASICRSFGSGAGRCEARQEPGSPVGIGRAWGTPRQVGDSGGGIGRGRRRLGGSLALPPGRGAGAGAGAVGAGAEVVER